MNEVVRLEFNNNVFCCTWQDPFVKTGACARSWEAEVPVLVPLMDGAKDAVLSSATIWGAAPEEAIMVNTLSQDWLPGVNKELAKTKLRAQMESFDRCECACAPVLGKIPLCLPCPQLVHHLQLVVVSNAKNAGRLPQRAGPMRV